jgi:hypothetical protein
MAMIEPGSKVLARNAFDELLERRAITGVQPGYDFPVVWVCSEEEWQAAQAEGREPEGLPWPAKHVQLAEESALRES